MSVGAKKAVVGIAAGLIGIGLLIPVAFWFAALALDRAFHLRPVLDRPATQILSAGSILIGAFWVSWAYSYLLFVGKGLPIELFGWAFHPTRTLVTTGPYAYTRNPVVLGLLFLLLGVSFLEGSISGLVMVPVVALLALIYLAAFEEKGLAARFPEDYPEYRRNVPRLLPRVTPYVHEPAIGP
ncbi:MAG: hypothetical protein A2Z18_10000 [Armatimonadetes bacterium RBG_16_58_9]|nr:MAG: hypothetical protein A2Z18_10000 [Armatimonadetes bacterium RBG_16_58_9]